MLDGAVPEDTAYCRQFDPAFAGFDTAWSPTTAAVGAGWAETYVGWKGFTVGIVLAFAVYANGLGVARMLMRFPPLRLLRAWLYHRMFFDELYFAVVVSAVRAASAVAGWFDRVVIDTVVTPRRRPSAGWPSAAGAADRRVVDGAVGGVAALAVDLGVAARLPQTGRVRVYVAALAAAVVAAVAAAVVVAVFVRRRPRSETLPCSRCCYCSRCSVPCRCGRSADRRPPGGRPWACRWPPSSCAGGRRRRATPRSAPATATPPTAAPCNWCRTTPGSRRSTSTTGSASTACPCRCCC